MSKKNRVFTMLMIVGLVVIWVIYVGSEFGVLIENQSDDESKIMDSLNDERLMNEGGHLNRDKLLGVNDVLNTKESIRLRPEEVYDHNPSFKTLRQRIDAMISRRPSMPFSDAEVFAAMKKSDIWRVMNGIPITTPLSDEELYDGKREFIEVDPARLESLMQGDSVRFPDPNGVRDLTLVITDTTSDIKNNIVTWTGYIKEYGGENSHFTMTRGVTLTSAIISTPDTNFSVEIFGSQGSLVNSSDIFDREGDPIHPPSDAVF